ncbi:MAG TPA: hypothetical protein PKA64_12460, partial [Myxococcota bacterium]|nr:hypothetical protein [Myxococcota bacterium]
QLDAGVVGDVVLRVGEPAPCPGEGPGSSCVELRLSRERPLDVGDEASTSRLWVVERWWVAPDALRLAAASREVRVGWRAGDGAELQAAGTRSWTVWRDPPAPP